MSKLCIRFAFIPKIVSALGRFHRIRVVHYMGLYPIYDNFQEPVQITNKKKCACDATLNCVLTDTLIYMLTLHKLYVYIYKNVSINNARAVPHILILVVSTNDWGGI